MANYKIVDHDEHEKNKCRVVYDNTPIGIRRPAIDVSSFATKFDKIYIHNRDVGVAAEQVSHHSKDVPNVRQQESGIP